MNKRGEQPGLVHIFSAMETCHSYQPWHDKTTGKTYLKAKTSKCLHYYFYFIDAELGLCFLRVSTWCPFTLEFYFNGHAQLATRLKEHGIAFEQRDNAFTNIADFEAANQLAHDLNIERLHAKLDEFARRRLRSNTSIIGVFAKPSMPPMLSSSARLCSRPCLQP